MNVVANCTFPECSKAVRAKGLCVAHYNQQYRGQPLTELKDPVTLATLCTGPECARKPVAKDLCASHYYQQRKGKLLTPLRKVAPKGSGWRTADGYRVVSKPGHSNARSDGKILEHVFIMSEQLGRPLVKGENVHHKNGVRDDNRPDNLELWVTSQPSGQRPEDLVAWAKEILARYPTL